MDDGRKAAPALGLLDLPMPLMLDHLLPLLSNQDLASLSLVSKDVRMMTADEMVWKRKTVADFKFPPHATARVGGWHNLYRGLSDPNVYIWGEIANGRLGMQFEELPLPIRRDVGSAGGMPYPYRIPTTGGGLTRSRPPTDGEAYGSLVEIVAGGWSFHARTSTGKIWVWGTMNPETWRSIDGSHISPNDVILTPELLQPLPPIQSLASGRSHTVALTDSGEVLEWRTWGLVWNLDLGFNTSGISVKQLEAGWSFSAVLTTENAEVWIWYSDWTTDAWNHSRNVDAQSQQQQDDPSLVQRLHVSPCRLPIIPTKSSDAERREIVQVAAGEDFVVALTSDGELHRLDLHLPPASGQDWHFVHQLQQQRAHDQRNADTDAVDTADEGFRAALHRLRMNHFLHHTAQWENLRSFSNPQSLPTFQQQWIPPRSTLAPISHISAHFKHFVAFMPISSALSDDRDDQSARHTSDTSRHDDTIVLLGSSISPEPVLVPEIQARGVIKVSMGDYHYGALTQQGELLTWGQFSKGALGNWPPPSSGGGNDRDPPPANSNENGGWSNLIPLPRIFGRGPTAPRVGRPGAAAVQMPALPGSRAARHRAGQPPEQPAVQPAARSKADVQHPTPISLTSNSSHPDANRAETRLFAYDIAFAGWQSSALVMVIPDF